MSFLRWFIGRNIALSKGLDRLLWPSMAIDGNQTFVASVKPMIGDGLVIADIGGGKTPLFTPEEVARKRLHVIGLDLDQDELDAAPAGAYAEVICADITRFRGEAEADNVIVQSLLEHVSDNSAGMKGIASLCKPGGQVYTFCPNRRAWFAIINRALPESLKRRILYAIYPHTREKQGFPAFYDRCTPEGLSRAMEEAGLRVENVETYFISSYFMFFFPLYFVWRVVTLPLMKLSPMQFCETFAITAVKPLPNAD